MRSQKTGTLLRRGALRRFVMTAAEGKNPWMLAAAGLIAGFINGLIGAGGGVFIVRSAAKLLPRDEKQRRATYTQRRLRSCCRYRQCRQYRTPVSAYGTERAPRALYCPQWSAG